MMKTPEGRVRAYGEKISVKGGSLVIAALNPRDIGSASDFGIHDKEQHSVSKLAECRLHLRDLRSGGLPGRISVSRYFVVDLVSKVKTSGRE